MEIMQIDYNHKNAVQLRKYSLLSGRRIFYGGIMYEELKGELKKLFQTVGDYLLIRKVVGHHANGATTTTYFKRDKFFPLNRGYHIHRTGGKPAKVTHNQKTDNLLIEQYYENDRRHRAGGKPAVIFYDEKTGAVSHERYYENGSLHRAGDKPAWVVYNPATSVVTYAEYIENGRQYDQADSPLTPDEVRARRPIMAGRSWVYSPLREIGLP